MAFSGSQTTRLGLYGGSRSLYGSFVGKALAEFETVIVISSIQGDSGTISSLLGKSSNIDSLLGKRGTIDSLLGQGW